MAVAAMTSHVARLYAVALALVVFFLTWAMIAARPWASSGGQKADPRLAALAAREQRIRHESLVVRRIVRRRWARYRVELRKRNAQIAARRVQNAAATRVAATAAAAPSVSVVSLPPVTITRTS